jgi:diguanylate cyclase (GGDEF)-like protein/PAS domain S-box-containing protein
VDDPSHPKYARLNLSLLQQASLTDEAVTTSYPSDKPGHSERTKEVHAADWRFRVVQDASLDGFAIFSAVRGNTNRVIDFEFVYSNPAGSGIIAQLAPDRGKIDLVGHTLLEILPHLHGTPLIRAYRRVLLTGVPIRTEYQFGNSDAPIWSAITAFRVGNELAINFSDITTRKLAEQYLEQANEQLERGVAARTAELRESEERYRTVLAATPDGIALQRQDYSIVAWNPAAERITGLTQAQVEGTDPKPDGWSAFHEDGSEFLPSHHPSPITLDTGEPQNDRVMGMRHPDGRTVWISMDTRPLVHDGETKPYAVVTSFSDVTARREAEAALRESEQRFKVLATRAPVGIFHTDADGACTYVNERYCALTHLEPKDALGDGWKRIIHPDDLERVVAEWRSASAERRSFRMEYRMRNLAGETVWVEGSADATRDASGAVTGYIGGVHDLSERKLAEEALRLLSLRDELTGVWNRRGLFEQADEYCRRAQAEKSTILVMYGDVNSFKALNDTHGHAAGDGALTAVAAALQATCRNSDVVARIGGDEFVMMSMHESAADAEAAEFAMRARLRMHLAATSERHPYELAMSVGAASCTGAPVAFDVLLSRADEALYEQKRLERRSTVASR